jgi:hypothetical protein
MFSHLLESSFPHRRSRAGVAASAVAHIALIAAASRPAFHDAAREHAPRPRVLYVAPLPVPAPMRQRPDRRDVQPGRTVRPTGGLGTMPVVSIDPTRSPDAPPVTLPPIGDPFPSRSAPGPASSVGAPRPFASADGDRVFSAPEVDEVAAALPGTPPPPFVFRLDR